MKIAGIKIELQAVTEGEKEKYPDGIILYRDEGKLWSACENGQWRGLYPYEVKLANDLQELIIQKFNGKIK